MTTTPPEIPERATNAKTKPTQISLKLLHLIAALFCHRDPESLTEGNLTDLTNSLQLEGLQTPIEVAPDGKGAFIVIKGHRRVSALRILAARNIPGFTEDMEVSALEVVDATPQDLLLRSVLDNEVRRNLTVIERIKAGKKLYDAGVPIQRAAFALGVSEKQFGRDLKLAQSSWMLQHVIDESIGATNAVPLLDEAEKAGRSPELKEDFDAWVAEKKKAIREKERLKKAKDGKDLRPAEKAVKNYLTKQLVDHWVGLLRDKKRFDDDARWNFAAGIEAETGQLRIASLTLNVTNAPLENVAKVAAQLSQLAKDLIPFLETRSLMEAPEGPQARLRDEHPVYDLDILRQHGMEDLAITLEQELVVATDTVDEPSIEEDETAEKKAPEDQPQ